LPTETYSMPTFTKRGQDLFAEMGPDAYQNVEPEELLEDKLRCLLLAPSPWQKVIHGVSFDYRFRVIHGLLQLGHESKAEKFALCGRGDYVMQGSDGSLKVIPRRCGNRLCVRCARLRGGKFVHRVFEILDGRSHGFLHHVVLTQRVHPGESLVQGRARLRSKWMQLGGKRKIGYEGGLLVEHVKWSERLGGWHPHYHLIMEADKADAAGEMLTEWRGLVGAEEGWDIEKARAGLIGNPGYCRTIAKPDDKLFDLDGTQELFWKESSCEVARALQYVVRDVSEGPDKEGFSAISDSKFTELMVGLENARMHTLLGDWRAKKDPEEEENEIVAEDAKKGNSVSKDAGAVAIGTVDECCKNEAVAVRFASWLLEHAGGNQTALAIRARSLAHVLLNGSGI